MIKLFISEEYGFREWLAKLTYDQYEDLKRRWKTIRGLTCSVPVNLVIPQAKLLDDERKFDIKYDKRCHMHDYDDSYLEGVDYQIPIDTHFWMEGRMYELEEYYGS